MADADQLITLSIDIGTTTVVAARSDGAASGAIIRMPAVVGVDGGEIVTGEAAAELALAHPDKTVAQLVRRLGDSSPIVLDGRAFNVAALLGQLVADVAIQSDVDPATSRLVLTHPAAWKDHRLDLLRALGASQGFAAVDVVPDALAATNSMLDLAPAHVLVVDVGGGTVDATVVAIEAAGSRVVATQSLERLGGNDFDQAVFGHVMTSVDNMIADLDRRDPAVRQALLSLRASCTTAKEQLSNDTDATVAVAVPGLDTAVRITRSEFESLIRPQVEAIVTLVDRVVATAGADTIARVVTTGGSASIPLLGETLSGHLGQPSVAGADPAGATALGGTFLPAPTPSSTPAAHTDAPPSTTTSPERGTPMTDEAPTNNEATATDNPVGAGAATEAATTKRAPIAPPPSPEKKETSTGAKVAVGATVAAAAAAAAVVFGDDVAAALEGDDEATPTDTAATDAPADDSMDEFDTVAPADDAAGPAGVPLEPAGVPLDTASPTQSTGAGDDFDGTGGPSAFSSPAASRPAPRPDRPDRPRADRDNDGDGGPVGRPLQQQTQPQARPQPQREAAEPAAARVRDAPDAPEAPLAARAAPAAAPAATATPTPNPPPAAPTDPGTAGIADDRFEAARATLLERLENFEAPAGTSPEDAAVLQQELADAVARFQPQPGQTTEAALAAMRDDYDQRVQDFVQDQKIDAIVEEMERDNQAEAEAAAAEPATSDALGEDSGSAADGLETSPAPPTDGVETSPAPPTADGGIPAAPFDAGDVTLRSPDLRDIRPDLGLVDSGPAADPSASDDVVVSPGVGGRAGVVGVDGGVLPAAAAEPFGSAGRGVGAATASSESAATGAGSAKPGVGLEDDFDAAASRFEGAPVMNQPQPTGTAAARDVQFDLADTIGAGPVDVATIQPHADTFKFAEGLEPVNLGRARAGGDDDDEDGNFTIGRAGGDGAGGDDDDDFGLTIGRAGGDGAGGDDDDDFGLTIGRAGGDDDDEDGNFTIGRAGGDGAGGDDDDDFGLTIGRAGGDGAGGDDDDDFGLTIGRAGGDGAGGDDDDDFGLTIGRAGGDDDDEDGNFTIEDPQTIETLTPVGLAPVATAQVEQPTVPTTIDLDDDVVGDSVYSAVVDTPISVIDVPAPDAILIGLDQPAPEGILIGLDQPGVSEIDAGGLQVSAPVTEVIVPPVYAEPEPFMADVPIVEEAVQDFGVQGLEDEGNIPADVPDDMLDG